MPPKPSGVFIERNGRRLLVPKLPPTPEQMPRSRNQCVYKAYEDKWINCFFTRAEARTFVEFIGEPDLEIRVRHTPAEKARRVEAAAARSTGPSPAQQQAARSVWNRHLRSEQGHRRLHAAKASQPTPEISPTKARRTALRIESQPEDVHLPPHMRRRASLDGAKKVCVYQQRKVLACFKNCRDAATYVLLDGRRGLTLTGGTPKRRKR